MVFAGTFGQRDRDIGSVEHIIGKVDLRDVN